MKKFLIYSICVTTASLVLFIGWGGTGHRIINSRSTGSFPFEMRQFLAWADSLGRHASDADNRKGSDPNEAPKHFIDIDAYPEFVANGRISQSYDSMVATHGLATVIDNGTLPWSILITVDTLTRCFQRGDMRKAMLTASDLGHYVGDGHMPLHITKNYNGQLSGQTGVHSRYESTMIDRYQNQIVYSYDSAAYISNLPDFVFGFIYGNYTYVDSVLRADSQATVAAGGTGNTTYTLELWNRTGIFTRLLFKNASQRLAALVYTAWVNAGKPSLTLLQQEEGTGNLRGYRLEHNYPNPFNPETRFSFTLPSPTDVSVSVYSADGTLVSELTHGYYGAGTHTVGFDAGQLRAASGIYYYRLLTPNGSLTRKMVYLR